MRSWFIIDFLACIPFDDIISATTFGNLFRVARVGRLYKLIKLTRLLRLLKVMRDRNRLLKYLSDFFRFGLGFERLFFFILLFLMLVHILACLFIFVAQGDDNSVKDSWVNYYYT